MRRFLPTSLLVATAIAVAAPAAPALVAAGALPAAAEAAHHRHTVVRSVSGPRTAVAGGPVGVEVRAARTASRPVSRWAPTTCSRA